MIRARDLPTKLRVEAIKTAAYVINHTGPKNIADMTPYELWLEKKAAVDHTEVFGTEFFAHIAKQKRRKWDKKAVKGVIVGYCGDKESYRIWDPAKQDTIFGHDVTFKKEYLIPTTRISFFHMLNQKNGLM